MQNVSEERSDADAQPSGKPTSRARFAGLVLDLDACTLARESGEAIPLTRGELRLLRLFVSRPARVLSRDAILNAVANRPFEPFDRSVDAMVVRLRRKIEPDLKQPQLIVTVPGEGYRFDGLTQSLSSEQKPSIAVLASPDDDGRPDRDPGSDPPLAERPAAFGATGKAKMPMPEQREATRIVARASEGARPPVEATPRSAERRHVTALAAELVWAEGASSPNDPEDLRVVIDTFRRVAAEALGRYGSAIGESRGREIVAYFGHRQTQENDAERSVRAALAIQRALSEINSRNAAKGVPQLSARVGIDSGPVIVEATGEVIGQLPSAAEQVRAGAEPGSTLVTINIQRQVAGLFVAEDRGAHALKGAPEPTTLFRIVRASGGRRFGARALASLVGRVEELDLLRRCWERAVRGEGQLALVVGEPGIGKSRLVEEFRTKLGEAPHTFVEWSSSQLLQNTPLHPIAEWGRQRFGCDEPAEGRLADLEGTLRLIGLDPAEYAPLLAPLVEIPLPADRAAKLAPEELRRRQLAAVVSWVLAGARSQPVVLAFEDLHWADPTSLELMTRLAERGAQAPLFIIATTRPEFRSPWSLRSHHSVTSLRPLDHADVARMVGELAARLALSAHVASLQLSRFGRRQATAMVDRVTGAKALPAEVLEQIVTKTDGVPLFVEELTKMVMESGLLREGDGGYVLASALTPLAIPSTLQDSLMARLDRLAPVKETAQIGAAIGREFSYRLLEAVSPIQGAELEDALAQLMAAELIHGRGAPPEATYVFKHALVQDTAYGSLLRSRRQHIHTDIARALEEKFTDQVAAAPATIARHYTEAELADPAARYWLAASELALSRSAYAEADRYVDAGLALIPRLPQGTDRQSLELAFHVTRAAALAPLKAYTAPETVAAFRAAKRLLDAGVGDNSQRFFVLSGLYMTPYIAARLESALELAREFVEAAERQDEPYYRLSGYRMLAQMQIAMGQNREALKNLQRAVQFRDPSRKNPIGFRFSIDPGLAMLCSKIWVLSTLGLHDQAARVRELVRGELPDHKLPGTIALYMQLALAWPELMYGDFEAAERYAAEHVAFCVETKVEQFRLWGGNYQASARAMREPTEENVAALRDAIAANNRSGGYFSDSIFKSYLAEALLMGREMENAEAALQDAFAFVEQSGERFWLADLYRVDGQIALRRPEPGRERAEACFLKAIEVAHGQEARMLELRAATDLVRLWRQIGARNDPRALLEPILATIEGGETTRDVRNARALLAEIV